MAYTASKGAVLAMTREIAVVHARENIRANSLCPGPLRTELLMKVGNNRIHESIDINICSKMSFTLLLL